MDPYTTSRDSIQPTFLSRLVNTVQNQWQKQLDRLVPFVVVRWILFLVMFVLFGIRIYTVEGFYIVTYALGIYLLHLFINFLAPREDPDAEGPLLPNYDHDEYKPFVRKLPEYKFWYAGFRALAISCFLTLFSMFDLPVFWPILVIYFCVLFFITMKRQVKHMMKWKYLPFSFGKPKFRGNDPKKGGGVAFRGGPSSSGGSRAPGAGLMSGGPSHLKSTGGPKRVNPSAGFMGNVARSSMRSHTAASASAGTHSSASAAGIQKTNGIGVSGGSSRPGIGASMASNMPTMTGMLGGGGGGGGLSTTRPTNVHRSNVGTSGVGVSGM